MVCLVVGWELARTRTLLVAMGIIGEEVALGGKRVGWFAATKRVSLLLNLLSFKQSGNGSDEDAAISKMLCVKVART
jgi:hypothetical protein